MNIKELRDRTVVFGLNATGKTYLAKKLLEQTDRHMVFDAIGEYAKFNRYVPESRQYPEIADEFDLFYKKLIKPNANSYDLLVIDEANRIAPNKRNLPYGVSELNDFYAEHHMDLPFLCICRRPSQLNTDLVSLAQKMVLFRLTGKADKDRLNQEVAGLGDLVSNLSGHNFIVVNPDRTYNRFEAL